MSVDIQKQRPFTTSQIETEKPNAPRSENMLSGYIAGGLNAGHNTVIGWKQITAGERHKQMKMKICMQMLTPLTPAYQKLKMTVRTYFVPNSRVWENAEKFQSQKGGWSEEKVLNTPNTLGKQIPVLKNDSNIGANLSQTTIWRDMYIGQYYPRFGETGYNINNEIHGAQPTHATLPTIDVLLLRGRNAIYNDKERNKEFDPIAPEFKGDTCDTLEWSQYIGYERTMDHMDNQIVAHNLMRAKKDNSYYSNFRTELQGFRSPGPGISTSPNDDSMLLTDFEGWLNKVSEARAQASNAQKTDWEIIAEIRGSKLLTEGKVQLIGQKTFDINYSAITQNTYNNNQEISEEFRVMGKQGAYSYTEVEIPLYAMFEFNEDGYIHVIATCSADTVYENAIDRTLLNTNWESRYRPDMEGEKEDVLYLSELGTVGMGGIQGSTVYKQPVGFKRRYSENFKLPNVIHGDMTSQYWVEVQNENVNNENLITIGMQPKVVRTQKTFQFFQNGAKLFNDENASYWLDIWKDYSDLLINRNQAIKNNIMLIRKTEDTNPELRIEGNQQIIYVGVLNCLADLPINEEIKNDYTKWAEF